jgi:putative transposase
VKGLARHFGCSLSLVCGVLEKPRSWIYYRRRIPKGRTFRRTDLLEPIREILRGRPASYGYRRVHAMLLERGIVCNPKTVWAFLRRKGWLSTSRQKTMRPGRSHDGKVAVPEPNRRWASDFSWIRAWNGEKGRLAVIIDCADRMILAWRFQPNINTETMCEIVREAVFHRFGADRHRAQGLEFLTDNGTEFKKRFQGFLKGMGLTPCHTPCRSPESNGLVESFFKTLKRDYVYQSCIETREDVRRQVSGWIADYNEIAPHSSLGMRSPARFYREWKAKNGLKTVQN